MGLVLGFYGKDYPVTALQAAFHAQAPEIEFRAWPNWQNREEIDYLLVWHPQAEMFTGCSKLRLIFSLGAGVDHLTGIKSDLPPRVPVIRFGDHGLKDCMASYVMMAVQYIHRDMFHYRLQQKQKSWLPGLLATPGDHSIGFLGFGNMAHKPAALLNRMGHPVVSWSRTAKKTDETYHYHGLEQLSEFLSRSDILVCLLPATPDTNRLLTRERLLTLPQGAGIVNAGRGNLWQEWELLEVLDSGHLSGLVLDVFQEEPLPADSELWDHPQVLVTPHIASPSLPDSMTRYVVEGIRKDQAGESLPNRVDWNRGY